MTRDEAFQNLKQAAEDGSLMTPKHDPQNLTTTFPRFRTVLSHELAQNLEGFIASGQYKLYEYENKALPTSPLYLEIEPQGTSFSIPASGVPANPPLATTAVNRLVAVRSEPRLAPVRRIDLHDPTEAFRGRSRKPARIVKLSFSSLSALNT